MCLCCHLGSVSQNMPRDARPYDVVVYAVVLIVNEILHFNSTRCAEMFPRPIDYSLRLLFVTTTNVDKRHHWDRT